MDEIKITAEIVNELCKTLASQQVKLAGLQTGDKINIAVNVACSFFGASMENIIRHSVKEEFHQEFINEEMPGIFNIILSTIKKNLIHDK